MDEFRKLISALLGPLFIIFDALGTISCFVTVYLPPRWHPLFFTLGSSLLTIGITLPAAVFFQSTQNKQAFKILNSCSDAGIESIFASRKDDWVDLRPSLEKSLMPSKKIDLLGVSFRTYLDPSGESMEPWRTALNSVDKVLRVLILDPSCEVAFTRDLSEFGNATIADINHSLSNELLAITLERLKRLKDNLPKAEFASIVGAADKTELKRQLKMHVRKYSSEPVAHVTIFDNALFAEQYHRGRPEEIVPIGSCIGKYMPVIQYRKHSYGYRFLECHFEQIWSEAREHTDSLLSTALPVLGTIFKSQI